MPSLQVYQKGKKIFCLLLDTQRISIGRLTTNDLILAGDEVSRTHAVIENRNDEFWLVDQSTLGTYVNEERVVKETQLRLDDEIRISDWKLVIADEKRSRARETHATQLTQTIPVDDTKLVKFDNAGLIHTYKPLLLIEDAKAGSRHVHVRKRQIVIGTSESCDIVLKDDYVSKNHAEFRLSDQGFHVVDLGSTNGTFINGAKIKECYLKENQEIILGRSKILVMFESDKEEKIIPAQEKEFCGIIGESRAMRVLFPKIEMAAKSEMTTLVLGETGSGKELIARALHDLSSRRDKPFVIINCGAISPTLIESEIFGHEKGAFTGADVRHLGAFEQAHQGSLFLDEVGELPLELQSKILRVLEYQTLRRVGGREEIKVDVRLIAATHRDLAKMVAEQKFREDLFYRLFVLLIRVPPLRERPEDVAVLAEHFVGTMAAGRKITLAPDALKKLKTHNWPGNVRELKNTIMRALAFCQGDEIKATDIEMIRLKEEVAVSMAIELKEEDIPEPGEIIHPQAPDAFEKKRIEAVLEAHGGDKNAAAKDLGMGRSTLFRKIKELGIE